MKESRFARNTLPRFFHSGGVDLVNLGDCRAFMLSQDNLYKVCVADQYRGFPIDQHYAWIERDGHQVSSVTPEGLASVRDARYGVYLILHHLIANGTFPTFLDVGAYVGDVGIRYANFFRTLGYPGKVFCFDPTLAGDLIPYNISLNGLERYVEHRSEAVSDFSGLVTFEQKQGHADSASALMGQGEGKNTIVPCVKLSEFIREQNIQSAFIKLDTENLEQRILADIDSFLIDTPSAVCFEVHAHQKELVPTMAHLLQTHYLFDVGYLPRPFCFMPLDARILSQFSAIVSNYPYRYTDVLAISRNIPGVERLVERLTSLAPSRIEYSLVMEPHTAPSVAPAKRFA